MMRLTVFHTAFLVVAAAGLTVGVATTVSSCGGSNNTASPSAPSASGITSDANLYQLISITDPFKSYAIFPNAAEITSGTLNGSSAHQPLVRVTVNAKALGALQNGKLAPGTKFPDGSVIVKEVRSSNGATVEYTVIYKDAANSLAGNGWLWAAFKPDGSVSYSIRDRGSECVNCHSREQGPRNDSVRTFERQQR